MKLVIVESPNKTKTISQFLGNDYKVMASVGHVRDLATTGKNGLGVDVDHNFTPTYKVLPNKYKTVSELKNAVKKADEVYLATDPDREGEAIAWHLAVVLGLDITKVKRLTFNAITKKAVLQAMEQPGKIDMDLVASQETRRILDRIIGFDLSELMKRKIKTKSAGRVQSVTLRMIVEHQKEIDAFVSKDYYDVKGIFGESKLETNLYSKDNVIYKPYSIDSEEKYNEIVNSLPKKFKVEDLVSSQRTSQPRPPFTTSSLEQEAYSRYGYGVKLTSSLAQKLFEGIEINGEFKALITYIRTDSTRLAPDFIEVASQYIVDKYGAEYYAGTNTKKGKSELVQDAHEAIRPVDLSFTPSMAKSVLPSNMYNLYRMIYARSIASLMKPKIDQVTTVKFTGNGYTFKTEASKVAFKGYSQVYEDVALNAEKVIKELPQEVIDLANAKGEIDLVELNGNKKSTQPPSKYNDGTVVKLMEEKGIGRPSTYSSTISTLVDREYVVSTKHTLVPTDSGKLVVESLVKFFPELMDYSYTRDMESKLEMVKEGGTSKVDLLSNFYTSFVEQLSVAKEKMEKVKDVETGELCPLCGSPLVIKKSKYGQFVACSNYPSCHFIKKDENKKEVEEVPDRVCPNCGGKLVYRYSRRGEKFIGCANFPKCKFTDGLTPVSPSKEGEEKANNAEASGEMIECPKCHQGHLVVKKSRFGSFYGCSNYPKCRYTQKIEVHKKDENN